MAVSYFSNVPEPQGAVPKKPSPQAIIVGQKESHLHKWNPVPNLTGNRSERRAAKKMRKRGSKT